MRRKISLWRECLRKLAGVLLRIAALRLSPDIDLVCWARGVEERLRDIDHDRRQLRTIIEGMDATQTKSSESGR